MKQFSYLISIAFVALFFVTSVSAQSAAEASKKVKYDPKLARKLGGNDNGMRGYIFVMLRTGPNDGNYKGKERDDLFAGHMANIGRLADMGKLILAGPFEKNDRAYRGIFVFNTTSVEEVQKLVETDPTVKAGVLIADIIPWWATAALMMVPEVHPKIMKPKK